MKNLQIAVTLLSFLGLFHLELIAAQPSVTTLAATSVIASNATLNGTVNPGGLATSAWFEWGTASFNYHPTAPVALGSGLATLAVSNNLSGLTPGIIYRGHAVASNNLGIVRGKDVRFGSPAILLNVGGALTNECHFAFTDPTTVSGTLLAVGAGDNHGLGVKSDGTVAGWGSNDKGQATIPAGLSNVVAVAGGEFHSLALKSDGTVTMWGDGSFFQLNIPPGLSNVVAIDAGAEHSLALKSDGTVVAWGYNGFGQTTIPVGLSNVVAIAAGYGHNLAVKNDGTVVAWGINTYGQATVPEGLSNVVALGAGYGHSLALKSDGTVAAWGWNTANQANVPGNLSNVVALGVGAQYSVALKSNGTVTAWGLNGSGQLNIPAGLTNVVALAVGDTFNLALRSDGTVVGWGANGYGQTTIPAGLNTLNPNVDRNVSTSPPGSYLLTYTSTNGFGGIATPVTRTVVVVDTTPPVITVLGNNPLFTRRTAPLVDPGATALDACGGALAVSTNSNVNVAAIGSYTVTYTSTDSFSNTNNGVRTVVVADLPAVVSQSATGVTAGAATLNGTVNPGGSPAGYYFQYGTTSSYGSVTPAGNLATGTTTLPVTAAIGSLSPGIVYHFRLVATNSVGTNAGVDLTFTPPLVPPVVATQPASGVTTNAATLNGTVNPSGFASGYYFQYGATTNYGSATGFSNLAAGVDPLAVNNLIGGLSVGALYHFRIVATNRWGTNAGADLTFSAGLLPAVVTQPATGMSNSVARLNGTINPGGLATSAWFEWGTASFNYQPTAPVTLGSGLATLAVSNNLSGLTPGIIYRGRVVASNILGIARGRDVPLGSPAILLNGGAVLTNECHFAFTDPTTVSGTLLAVGAGYNHGLGVKSDGTVAGWGSNDKGQATIPAGLSNVVAVAGGEFHSLALKSDGTVTMWGDGSFFQLNIPPGLSNVVAIDAGAEHSLALKSDGTVVAWGYNGFGQTTIPVGLSNVVAIAAGYGHNLAVKNDGTVVAWGINTYGQATVPEGLSNVVALGAGYGHSLALKSDGTVAAWGWNTANQANVPGNLSNVVALGVGAQYSVALKSNGTVTAWGLNGSGQLNIPAGLTNVVALAVGDTFNLALRSDGTVVGWGANGYGQTTIPAGLNTLNLTVNGSVNTNAPGNYPLTYTATNGFGGIALATRTVVVRDTIPPVITMLGNNTIANAINVPFVDPGATALDACGGALAVSTNSTVNVAVSGSYTVTYTSADSYGNTTNRVRTVVVLGPPTGAVIHSITHSGTNLIFGVTNGVSGGGWTLLTTTNLAAPIHWSTNRVGAFNALGSVTLTNGINTTEPRRFFSIQSVVGSIGSGWSAQYYKDANTASHLVGTPFATRTDATINFEAVAGWPGTLVPGIGPSTFSVRWGGQLLVPATGSYTFYTASDDGVRLYLNGQPLIDNWTDHPPTTNSAAVTLNAGQFYPVVLEFYQGGGGSVISLEYEAPGAGVPRQIVPAAQVF